MKTWYGDFDNASRSLKLAASPEELAARLIDVMEPSGTAVPQPDIRARALDSGIFPGEYDYNNLLRDTAIALVRARLGLYAGIEAEAMQMIEALDDLNFSINLLDERLFEWSLLHGESRLRGASLAERLAGGTEPDIASLAVAVMDLRRAKDELQSRMEAAISAMAPNLSLIAGPILAARLISHAGGMKRLAELPASTIQLIGAEKSLFKHLKGRAPSPKHGLIYRHPAITGSPRWARGRVARAIAGKMAIAARIDHHSGVMMDGLKESLDRRIADIRRSRTRKSRA